MALVRGVLLLLCLGGGAAEAGSWVSPTLESQGLGDEVCDLGDEECALSLRQLRSARLHPRQTSLASEAMASADAGGELDGPGGEVAAAYERRASMTIPWAAPSSLVQAFAGKSKMVYHQTNEEIAKIIMASGFRRGNHGWCGGAIYFAADPKATFHKAIGSNSHQGVILGAQVELGKVCKMGTWCERSMTLEKLHSMGCDSITFNPGDGDEFVIYEPWRVKSLRVVWAARASKMGAMDALRPQGALPDNLGAELDAVARAAGGEDQDPQPAAPGTPPGAAQ